MGIDFRPCWYRTPNLNIHTLHQIDYQPYPNKQNDVENHISNDAAETWLGPTIHHGPVNNCMPPLHLLMEAKEKAETNKVNPCISNYEATLCEEENIKPLKTRMVFGEFQNRNLDIFEDRDESSDKQTSVEEDAEEEYADDRQSLEMDTKESTTENAKNPKLFCGVNKRSCVACYETLSRNFNRKYALNHCNKSRHICTQCCKPYCKKCLSKHGHN